MLVKFKSAIEENAHWQGSDVQAVAMGLEMVKQMERQYRSQVEVARRSEEESRRRAKDAIKEAGGVINGEPATSPA